MKESFAVLLGPQVPFVQLCDHLCEQQSVSVETVHDHFCAFDLEVHGSLGGLCFTTSRIKL